APARVHAVTVVNLDENEQGIRSKAGRLQAIEVVKNPSLSRIRGCIIRYLFGSSYRSQVLTALTYIFCVAFEWRAWRQTRRRIKAGDFDVVLRILPISSVLPSPFAFFLRQGPITFVIGPVNG